MAHLAAAGVLVEVVKRARELSASGNGDVVSRVCLPMCRLLADAMIATSTASDAHRRLNSWVHLYMWHLQQSPRQLRAKFKQPTPHLNHSRQPCSA